MCPVTVSTRGRPWSSSPQPHPGKDAVTAFAEDAGPSSTAATSDRRDQVLGVGRIDKLQRIAGNRVRPRGSGLAEVRQRGAAVEAFVGILTAYGDPESTRSPGHMDTVCVMRLESSTSIQHRTSARGRRASGRASVAGALGEGRAATRRTDRTGRSALRRGRGRAGRGVAVARASAEKLGTEDLLAFATSAVRTRKTPRACWRACARRPASNSGCCPVRARRG